MRTSPLAAVVAAFAGVLGCLVGAGSLLETAERPDGSTAFDSSITSWVVEHRTDALTTLARAFSAVGSQKVLTPVVIVVAVLLLTRRRVMLAGLLVAVWGGAISLYSFAKAIVGRPRPPEEIWLARAGGKAFPSGHAVQSMSTLVVLAVVAGIVLGRGRRAGPVLALLITAGVGWSRVYLGVHWTTDVLGGWLAAAAWTALVVRFVLPREPAQPGAASDEDRRRRRRGRGR